MLKNIAKLPVKLKWDGREAVIVPGATFDIGVVFPILSTEIVAMEARFIAKNPMALVRLENGVAIQPTPAPEQAEWAGREQAKDPEEAAEESLPIDPYKERKLEDHSQEELFTMAKAMKIPKVTKKTGKEKLVELIGKKLGEDDNGES